MVWVCLMHGLEDLVAVAKLAGKTRRVPGLERDWTGTTRRGVLAHRVMGQAEDCTRKKKRLDYRTMRKRRGLGSAFCGETWRAAGWCHRFALRLAACIYVRLY